MTAQPGRPQAQFTAGELAPTMRERRDLKYYRAGATFMRNVEVLPQGGFRYSGGSEFLAYARRDMALASLNGASFGAPNGGTALNAVDGDPATVFTAGALAAGGGPYSILTVTFPAPVAIAAVDIENFRCGAGTMSIKVEANPGSGFVSLTPDPKAVTTTNRSRRFAAPPLFPVTAAQWRILISNVSDTATVILSQVTFRQETASFGPMKLRPFTSKDGVETLHCLSVNHADVISTGWADSYALPYQSAEVAAVKTFQQLDTMMGFHQNRAPQRILRQGSDTEWQAEAAPLTNVPNYDYGGVYGNGVAAVWQVSVINAPADATLHNVAFSITVNGEESPALAPPLLGTTPPLPDWNGFAAAIQAAILALPGVAPGVTVTYGGAAGGYNYLTITFAGSGNTGNDWLVSMKSINKSDIACPAYLAAKGVSAGEAIISDARGYPRCGIFYQQSLLMGGLKNLPNAWLKSETGNYWNFQTDTSAATGAMVVPMDTQGGEAIEEMVAGRSVLIMTSLAEYFLADRAISKTQAPNHVEASRHGIAAGVPAAENEGAAILVHQSGSVLYEFRYDEVAQTFTTKNLSILASHLLSGITDLAVRRATATNDANMLYAANGLGVLPGLRQFALLREQDVTAGSRRETDGAFLSVCALQGSNAVGVIADRQVGAARIRTVERLDPNGLLDQAYHFRFDVPTSAIGGLQDLYEGAEIWAIADDDVLGPFTVVDGIINLPQKALNVTLGRWTAPFVETLPPDRAIGPGVVLERRGRVHTVRLALTDTTSLAIGANGGKIYDVPLFRFGDAPDVPALARKYTGVIKIQGLTGFADQPTVVITQKRPGYLNVRGITVEAAL